MTEVFWKAVYAVASWVLQGILTTLGVFAVFFYVCIKPKWRSWRCHFGIHDWERRGHKRQCRRCGDRQNDTVGLKRLKMTFDQLRMSIHQYEGPRSKDWQTPRWLYDELNERYGPFDLDPCTSEDNPLGTEYFYTEKTDGLTQDWIIPERTMTKFYMNPPYGRDVVDWVKKAHEQTQKWKPHLMGVGLLPVRTDPKWFHEYVLPYYEIIFLPGRVAFIDPETGKPVKGTNFASMLVIYR